MTPAESEYFVHAASLRADWPPLDASEMVTCFYCPAAGATSAAQARYIRRLARAHLEGVGRDVGMYGAMAELGLGRLLRAGLHTPNNVYYALKASEGFSWAPPPGSVSPLHLALLEDGSVIEFDPSAERPIAAILTANVDVAWSMPSALIRDGRELRLVLGAKPHMGIYRLPGDSKTTPANRDLELLAGSVLLGRYLETRSDVTTETIVMRDGDGTHDVHIATLAERQKIEGLIRQLVAKVEKARTDRSTEGTLDYAVGVHCHDCAVQQRCMAWMYELRASMQLPADGQLPSCGLDSPIATLHLLLMAERIVKLAEPRLKHWVAKNGPLILDDNRAWGPVAYEGHKYDSERAMKLLTSMFGVSTIDNTIYFYRKDIERIIKAAVEKRGVGNVQQLLHTFEETMVSRGEAVSTITTRHKLYVRPKLSGEPTDVPEEEGSSD